MQKVLNLSSFSRLGRKFSFFAVIPYITCFVFILLTNSLSAKVIPSENLIEWDLNSSFLFNGESLPQVELFEDYPYVIKNRSRDGIVFTIVESGGQIYERGDLLNNELNKTGEYLYWLPNDQTPRNLIALNPQDVDSNLSLEVLSHAENLTSKQNESGTLWGYSVQFDDDLNLFIGEPKLDGIDGEVHFYKRIGSGYEFNQTVSLSHSERSQFGSFLSLGTGELAVSAPDENIFSGAVYIYQVEDDIGFESNLPKQRITDPESRSGGVFGWRTSMDNNYLAISSLELGSDLGGKVTLFEKNSEWTPIQKFYPLDSGAGQDFGYDIQLHGGLLVVGVPGFDSPIFGQDSGLVMIYDMDEPDSEPYLISPSDLSAGDRFGHSVNVEGNQLYVGALFGDGVATDTGVIYTFEQNNTEWLEKGKISPPTFEKDQLFSQQIVISGNTLVSLSPNIISGSLVHVFKNDGGQWDILKSIPLSNFQDDDLNFLALDVHDGNVIVGNPNHDEYSGGVLSLYNPSWAAIPAMSLPPILAKENPSLSFMNEDDPLGLKVDFNASHPFAESIQWKMIDNNASESFWEINSTTGVFSYFPDNNFSGTHSFTLEVESEGGRTQMFFQVHVLAVPDHPVFDFSYPDALITVKAGKFLSLPLSFHDADGDDLNLVISEGVLPPGLSLGVDKIEGVANLDSDTSAIFDLTFLLSDPSGRSATSSLSLEVLPLKAAPVISFNGEEVVETLEISLFEDFTLETWQNEINGLEVGNILNGIVCMEKIISPQNGILVLSETFEDSSDLKFLTDANFVGTNVFVVKFFYKGFPEDYREVQFKVHSIKVNDPPVIRSALPSSSVNEREFYSHTFDIADVDRGDNVRLSFSGLPQWLSFDGNSTIFGAPQRADFLKQESYNIIAEVADLSGSTFSQIFTITIIPDNYPPSIIFGDSLPVEMQEDSPEPYRGKLSVQDVDTPLEDLQWSVEKFPANGFFEFNATSEDFFFNYQPNADFFGHDELVIKVRDVSDPLAFDTLKIEFHVTGTPDHPDFSSTPYIALLHDTPWQYDIRGKDADGDLNLTLFNTTTLPDWLELRRKSDNRWILSGFVPGNQNDPISITLILTDSTDRSSEQSFSLLFYESIDQLVILEGEVGEQIINEDNIWSGGSLTVNETPGRQVTWTVIDAPENGDFAFHQSPNGLIENITYTPNPHFHGTDSVVIQVSDGFTSDFRSFSFRVLSVADKPEFLSFDQNITIEDRHELQAEHVFFDGDGFDNLSYSSSEVPEWVTEDLSELGEGKIRFSGFPGVDNVGSYSLKLKIHGLDDGLGVEQDFNFSVVLLNSPPQVSPQELIVTMEEDDPSTWVIPQLSATDLETSRTQDLFWQIAEYPNFGSASIDFTGTNFIYTPDANFSGEEFFSIKVTDTGGEFGSAPRSTEIPVEVYVTSLDDPPVILSLPTSDSDLEVTWTDEFPYHYRFVAYDSDWPWQGHPKVELISNLPKWAKWQDDGNGTVLISGNPSFLDIGIYPFDIKVTSGAVTLSQKFQLNLRVDDYPPAVIFDDNNDFVSGLQVYLTEDKIQEDDLSVFYEISASNPDFVSGDLELLLWSVGESPKSGGGLEIIGNGSKIQEITYTPPKHFNGVDEFSIEVSEGDRVTHIPVKIFIKAVPDPPYFIEGFEPVVQANLGDFFSVNLTAKDPENDEVYFRLFSDNQSYNSWLNIISESTNDGAITVGGTPPTSMSTDYNSTITLVATDASGRFATTQTVINYTQANRPPLILEGEKLVVFFDENLSSRSSALFPLSVYDPNGDSLSWEVSPLNKANFGEVLLEFEEDILTGVRYIPDDEIPSKDDFTLIVSDGEFTDEIFVNAFFSSSEFFVNFPDSIPSFYENESFEIQFFVSEAKKIIGKFTSTLISGPSWLSIESLSSTDFLLSGYATGQSAGRYPVTIRVTHPNGFEEQTLQFDLEIKEIDRTRINLVGANLLSVKKDLVQSQFAEPGYYAEDTSGVNISGNVEVIFPEPLALGKNSLTYTVGEHTKERVLLAHESSPFASFSEVRLDHNLSYAQAIPREDNFLILSPENVSSFVGDDSPPPFPGYRIFRESMFVETFSPESLVVSQRTWSELYGLETGEFSFWVVGSEPQLPSSDSESILFIDCYNYIGDFKWSSEVEVVGQFKPSSMQRSDEDELLVFGMLEGQINVGGESISSEENAYIGFVLDRKGRLKNSFIKDGIIASDACSYNSGQWYCWGNQYDGSGEHTSTLFSVDESGALLELASFPGMLINSVFTQGDRMFVYGSDSSSNSLNEAEFFIAEIYESGAFAWRKNLSLGNASSGILKVDGVIDSFGRLNFLIHYSGSFTYDGEVFESSGNKLTAILCISCFDGSLLWSDEIGGTQDVELNFVVGNEAGISAIGVNAHAGLSWKNQQVSKNPTTSIIKPISGYSVPFIDTSQSLQFSVDRLTQHPLHVLNSDIFLVFLENAPSWIQLIKNNGQYFLSGSPSIGDYLNFRNTRQSIDVRIVGYQNNITKYAVPIEILLSREWQDTQLVLPPVLQQSLFDGAGNIVSVQPYPQGLLVAANYQGKVEYAGSKFSTLSRSAGLLLGLDKDLGLQKSLNFSSSGSCNIVDVLINPLGEPLVVGNFRGTLKVGNSSIKSNGGTDVFIAKLTPLLECTSLRRLGGEGDEFVQSCSFADGAIYLCGYYFGNSSFGGKNLSHRGSTDAYIAKVLEESLSFAEWIFTYGGEGRDSADSISFCGDHLVMAGNFDRKITLNGKIIDVGNTPSAVLARFDLDGEMLNHAITHSSEFINYKHINYEPVSGQYIASGDFVGKISTNQKLIESDAQDLLIAVFNEDLEIVKSTSLGGGEDQSISSVILDDLGKIYLSGQFQSQVSLMGTDFESNGSSDAFLAVLELETLQVQDFTLRQTKGVDTLESFESLDDDQLILAGKSRISKKSDFSENSEDSMFLQLCGFSTARPSGEILQLGAFPVSAPFEIPFISYGWSNSANYFTVQSTNLPTWVKVSVDDEGNGFLSGFSPLSSGVFPLEFSLYTDANESAHVSGFIETKVGSQPPSIILDKNIEVKLYERKVVPVDVLNVKSRDIHFSTDFPDWASLIINDDTSAEIVIYPTDSTTGLYTLKLLAKSKISGLFDLEELRVQVNSKNEGFTSEGDVSYNQWNNSWLGTFLLKETGWCYHADLGWCYLQANADESGAWIWLKGWEWLWTEPSIWNGSEGYMYSTNLRDWIYFRKDSADNSRQIYNFSQKKWVKY